MTGEELRRSRKALGASLASVGTLAGLSDETVRKAELGHSVAPESLDAIGAALDALEEMAQIASAVRGRVARSPSVDERLARLEADLTELRLLVARLLDEDQR